MRDQHDADRPTQADGRPTENEDGARPTENEDELPAEDGLRSDHAGTGDGVVGPAPAGGDPERVAEGPAGDEDPANGAGTTAGGGYGVAADRPSSGNSGEGQVPAGEDAQTQWLRSTERT
ncbi:MAG: hypothetical protein ACLGIJ_09725 [Candidatus Limnocylindria bacterium]